jgi:hypothetical protein
MQLKPEFAWLIPLFLFPQAEAFSLGVGPGSFHIQLERGLQVNQTLTIGTDSDAILYCSLTSSGEIADWLSFTNHTTSVDPKSQRTFKVMISAPADAPNGNYSGSVLVTSIAPSSEGFTGMSVATAIMVDTLVEVFGFENRSYMVTGISAPSAIKLGENLPVEISVTNHGNIWVRPRVRIRVLDSNGNENYSMVQDSITIHPPGEKTIAFDISTANLPEGVYQLDLNVTWRDEKLRADTLQFSVVTSETPEKQAPVISSELISLTSDRNAVIAGEPVVLMVRFKNTGNVTVNATAKLSIKHNNAHDEVESDVKVVNPGKEASFSVGYTPKEYGTYEVDGYVEYATKQTEGKKAEFMVHSNALTVPKTNLLLYVFAALLLLSAILLARKLVKKNKKDSTTSQSPDSTAPIANAVNQKTAEENNAASQAASVANAINQKTAEENNATSQSSQSTKPL